ncbi:MAG: tetratricopeptide repeat protein, partial [Deltaproteobacteria bacterium]|nr:tetratricopeptide repeat protein [Deltaproteobacteria bacterium]
SELLIAVAEKSGDWASVIKYKQALLLSRSDPFEKFAVLLEIGDIYKDKLQNTYGAVSAYKEALEVDPDAKVALLRLFELYLETDAVEDALYTLDRLANAEDNPSKRAVHYIRVAALYQEKLGDDAKAIGYLNQALDSDPERLEAFRAIDEILTNNKDWEAQAENYRLMVERINDGSNPELEFRLYMNLGEIYRSRLKEIDYAISAYSRATQVKPDEIKSHEILAQLYEFTGDQFDKAVEEHRAIVNTNPLDLETAPSLKAMRRLFLEMKEFDKAFMTASALVATGAADETESEFFQGNLEPGLPWFKGAVDQLRWESHLLAGQENSLLGHVLQVLYQGLGNELGVRELKELGLKKKSELDLDQKLLFANVYKAAAKALGPLPHKVYRDDRAIGMKLEMLSPPGLIVGADMLTGLGEREAAFLIGRQLSYLHPMHFLASVKNKTELKVFLAAVMKFCDPNTQVSTGADVVTELVRVIEKKMPQQMKNQMAKLVGDLIARNRVLDVDAILDEFFKSMERTALRAGTLVCGSIDTAMDILRGEDAGFSHMTQKERQEEVVRFGISEDHFILRRVLGVALETGD